MSGAEAVGAAGGQAHPQFEVFDLQDLANVALPAVLDDARSSFDAEYFFESHNLLRFSKTFFA